MIPWIIVAIWCYSRLVWWQQRIGFAILSSILNNGIPPQNLNEWVEWISFSLNNWWNHTRIVLWDTFWIKPQWSQSNNRIRETIELEGYLMLRQMRW